MIPKSIVNAALARKVNVGRCYDSEGKHVAFYLRVSDNWHVYRHSVSGMLALLHQLPRNPH